MTILEIYYEPGILGLQVWRVHFFIQLRPRKWLLEWDVQPRHRHWFVQVGPMGCWGVL